MAHTDLFNLVKALTPSEKRYFTKWHQGISSREDNQQLILLDELYKMDSYSNTELIKRLGNKIKKGNLPPLKNTLFQNILLCLDNYLTINNKEIIIYKKIIRIHILIRKNLMAIAYKEIVETKALAKKLNVYTVIPSLNLLEFYNKRTNKEYFKALKNIITEGIEATDITNTYYRTFIYNLILEYQYFNNSNEFSEHFEHLNTKGITIKKDTPTQIRISLHEAKLFEALRAKNDIDALHYCKLMYEDIFAKNYVSSTVNKIIYTANYALTALKLHKLVLVNELLQVINNIKTTNNLETKYKIQFYYSITVEYLYATKEVNKVLKLKDNYFLDLKKLTDSTTTVVELRTLIYFLSAEITHGTLKEAYKLCIHINTISHKTIKENVSYITKILELIILFNQKEYTLLNSKINSVKYYFKKNTAVMADFTTITKLFSLEGKVILKEHHLIIQNATDSWNKLIQQANFDDLSKVLSFNKLLPKLITT